MTRFTECSRMVFSKEPVSSIPNTRGVTRVTSRKVSLMEKEFTNTGTGTLWILLGSITNLMGMVSFKLLTNSLSRFTLKTEN